MKRWSICLLVVFALSSFHIVSASEKVALMIGVDAYQNVPPLRKAVNDAKAMLETVEKLGFTKRLFAKDPTRRDFNRVLSEFEKAVGPGDVALFFFAGHGVHIEGRNYLLPADIPNAKIGDESFVQSEAIAADRIVERINRRGAQVNIVILDACRDNPFTRTGTRSLGGTRGLARMEPANGSFILYSAGVDEKALDRLSDSDTNPNSIFTRKLVPLLQQPGLRLTEIARQVRRDVLALAQTVRHQQTPAFYDAVVGDFYFVPNAQTNRVQTAPPPPATSNQAMVELAYWDSVKDSNMPRMLQSYLQRFPNGTFVELAKLKLENLKRLGAPPANQALVPQPRNNSPSASAAPRRAPTFAITQNLNPRGDNFLAIRSSPSSKARLLGKVYNNRTQVEVLERRGRWYRIESDGVQGWVYGKYLRVIK